MPRTLVTNDQIGAGAIERTDINTTLTGSAVITKVIAGTNITISSTGVDAGTGDVTINSTVSTGTAGGTAGSVQYNNSGTLNGTANVVMDTTDHNMMIATQSFGATVIQPSSGQNKLLSRSLGTKIVMGTIGPTGAEYQFQQMLSRCQRSTWRALGNNTTVFNENWGTNAVTGTATSRSVIANGTGGFNLFTASRRLGYVTANGAGSSAGSQYGLTQFMVGNGTTGGEGGFFYVARFGFVSPNSTFRCAIGLFGTAAVLSNVNPSTVLNSIYVGCDAGGGSLNVMANNGTGAATTIAALGATNFSTSSSNTSLYEVILYSPSNGLGANYRVANLSNGTFSEGNISSSNCPANSTLLAPQIWVNNGTVTGVVGVDIVLQSIETEN